MLVSWLSYGVTLMVYLTRPWINDRVIGITRIRTQIFTYPNFRVPIYFGYNSGNNFQNHNAPNARSEQITFDIADMVYPYNVIMGRGSINKFEAAIH
jgi:hypothetical protein